MAANDKGSGNERERLEKPFSAFKDFADCVTQQVARGKSRASAVRICGALMRDSEKSEARKKMTTDVQVDKVVWTRAFINTLPDSAFLYVAPGGKKDAEGKTVPRSLRYFPYRDKSGKVDLPHLRNAIARIPQSTAPGLSAGGKKALQERARRLLARTAKFALTWQQFEEDVPIRAASTKRVFHLFLERPSGVEAFQLADDPTGDYFEKIEATRREFPTAAAAELLDYEGEAAPGQRIGGVVVNPTKSTSSTLAVLAKGEVELLEDRPSSKKLHFKGEGLDGVFTLTETVPGRGAWFLEPDAAPADADSDAPQGTPQAASSSLMKCRGCGACKPYPEFAKQRVVRLLKQASLEDGPEERFVLGVVLEPETVDSQGDIYSEEDIRKTAHRFMEYYRNMGVMHKELEDDIRILESFLAPVDLEIEGQKVKRGTWVLGARIVKDEHWAKVRSGEFTGWSIGGHAIREAVS